MLHGRPPRADRRRSSTPAASSSARTAHGRITAIEGLDALLAAYGEHVVSVDLLPVGAPRRDWRTTVIGDGGVVVRHHELPGVIEMTDRFAADLQLYAS